MMIPNKFSCFSLAFAVITSDSLPEDEVALHELDGGGTMLVSAPGFMAGLVES